MSTGSVVQKISIFRRALDGQDSAYEALKIELCVGRDTGVYINVNIGLIAAWGRDGVHTVC